MDKVVKWCNDYCMGKNTLEGITGYIVSTYNSLMPDIPEEIIQAADNITSREWLMKRLFLQVVNRNKNRDLLKNTVHKDFLDLSLVLYVLVLDDGEGIGKIKVTEMMTEMAGLDKEEIIPYALENTMKLFPEKFITLEKLLLEKLPPQVKMPVHTGNIMDMAGEMIVLTNQCGIGGATALFYPGILKQFAVMGNKGLVILPSSIHEFILYGVTQKPETGIFSSMVKEVNRTSLLPEEVLSDNAYINFEVMKIVVKYVTGIF